MHIAAHDGYVAVVAALIAAGAKVDLQAKDGAFTQHSGNIQCTFREHSVHIQGTFSARSGNIQCTFREHSVQIPVPHALKTPKIQTNAINPISTFRKPSKT
jgi:hypothetical protein